MDDRATHIFFIGVFYFILGISYTGECRVIHNVNFPETITINGRNCKLNGVAVREILGFDIYIGALYLEKNTRSEKEAITSEQIKHVIMHFLYKEINKDLITESCMKSFKKNSCEQLGNVMDKIEHFFNYFTQPLKKGDSIDFTYIPGKGTEIVLQNELKGTIAGHDFMEVITSNWLGPFPPNHRFKKELLGP